MVYSSEQFFVDELVRDTLLHVSSSVYAGAFIPKTILFKNELDAAVDVEIFGCSKSDQMTNYAINSITITVPANSNEFETLDDYFQCFIIHITAQTTPTTGVFNSEMLMTSGG